MASIAVVRSPRVCLDLIRGGPASGRRLQDRLPSLNRVLPFAAASWDVIYFPWNSAAIACQAAFGLGIPVVISCRGTQITAGPHNPLRSGELREGLRWTFEKASAVHCVSRHVMRCAVDLGLCPDKATVITPAVDPQEFAPKKITQCDERPGSSDFRLVTVGTLIWIKGLEYMLSALRLLLDRGVPATLEIVGDGPDRQRVCYTVADLGLEGRVSLRGRQPAAVVRQVLGRADAFVFSSLSEGIPNAVLEAMASGLPVVTTACGGVAEVVRDGIDGFIIPARDVQAMAERLQRLFEDRALRARIGVAGRVRVVERFRLQQQIEAFANLLTACVDKVEPGRDLGEESHRASRARDGTTRTRS